MYNVKFNYKIIIVIFSLVLQSCAINDNKQLKKFIESSNSTLKNINEKPLTQYDIAAGLKEALKIGSERVVKRVGKHNGYLNDKAIHIVLPDKLQKVHKTLNKLGLGRYTNELELKMNRAAEIAAPKAKKLFYSAIRDMRWQDVNKIYNGNNTAATTYFKNKMTPSLKIMMKPLINKTLAEAGVIKAYRKAVDKYHSIPFVPKVKNNLSAYVMENGINGMFFYLAKEEAAIRKDPLKRTTELLRRVFEK